MWPIRQGRWESSWVPLGSDHMCPQGVWWQTEGAGGSREGSGGGSAKSDGPKLCEALLDLSSAPLNGAIYTLQNCCHPTSHRPTTPHPPNYRLPSGTARANQYKTIKRSETGLDHPDTRIHTNTPIMATRRRPQHESCSWKRRTTHTLTHPHTQTCTEMYMQIGRGKKQYPSHTETKCDAYLRDFSFHSNAKNICEKMSLIGFIPLRHTGKANV